MSKSVWILLLPLAGLVTGFSSPGRAAETLLRSKAPYWQVGIPDRDLSQSCGLGHFGQREQNRYVAQFVGAKGASVLGIAKGSGLNLFDPDHKARSGSDYFFLNQGTADCEVFVAQKSADPVNSRSK